MNSVFSKQFKHNYTFCSLFIQQWPYPDHHFDSLFRHFRIFYDFQWGANSIRTIQKFLIIYVLPLSVQFYFQAKQPLEQQLELVQLLFLRNKFSIGFPIQSQSIFMGSQNCICMRLISKINLRIQNLIQDSVLKMGKKQPAQKPVKNKAKSEDPVQDTKPAKRKSNKQADSQEVEILPKVLSEKFAEFGTLLNEINKQNNDAGKDSSFDVHERQTQLAQKIQEACKDVFKQELKEAEGWLEESQENLNSMHKKLKDSCDKARVILEDTKVFSKEQVDGALNIYEIKFEELRKSTSNNNRLMDLVKGIYLS